MLRRVICPFLILASSVFLGACASTDMTQSSDAEDQQTPSPTVSSEDNASSQQTNQNEAEAEAPLENSDSLGTSDFEFSGDYKEDLRSAGVEVPNDEGYELAVDRYADQYCEPPVSNDSDWLHFRLSLFNELDQGNDDIVRVVVHYECKHRMDLVEEVFAKAANRQ